MAMLSNADLGLRIVQVLDERFVFVGAALGFVGVLAYAWQTATGRTQPNRVTWVLWALAPLIAFAAEVHDGVRLIALLTFGAGFGPLLVLFTSFMNRHAYARITRFDMVCGACSLLALGAWGMTRSGVVAIILSICADALAAMPTVVKSWRFPKTERPGPYVLSAVGSFVAILAVRSWSLDSVGFPIYVCIICVVLASVISVRTRVVEGAGAGRGTRTLTELPPAVL